MTKNLLKLDLNDSTAPLSTYEAAAVREGIWQCEQHPDRTLEADPPVLLGTAYADGMPWTLYTTPEHWTIGDSKSMIALCPECSENAYEIHEKIAYCALCRAGLIGCTVVRDPQGYPLHIGCAADALQH